MVSGTLLLAFFFEKSTKRLNRFANPSRGETTRVGELSHLGGYIALVSGPTFPHIILNPLARLTGTTHEV